MRHFLFCITLTLLWLTATSQQCDSNRIELLQEAREFCLSQGMFVREDFYTQWSSDNLPYFYVYAAPKDSVTSYYQTAFRYFGKDTTAAYAEQLRLDSLGLSSLVYKTYGTSGTRLTDQFLNYSEESMLFVAFHEAMHHHVREKAPVPYILEEAAGDVIGNYLLLAFFKTKGKPLFTAKWHVKTIERIAQEINTGLNRKKPLTRLQQRIQNRVRYADAFKKDRYNYEVNTAYLLRNRSYTQHYFLLKSVLNKVGSVEAFLDVLQAIPEDEEQGVRYLEQFLEL